MNTAPWHLFLGEQGDNAATLQGLLNTIIERNSAWRCNRFPHDQAASTSLPAASKQHLESVLDEMLQAYEEEIPFFHPRYMAQMIHDAPLPAIVGLFSYLLNNPNNHAFEGGPVTTRFEVEVINNFLSYLGFPDGWGHLSSGGTSANLEAAWIAREHKGHGRILAASSAHFAWQRIANVLGMPYDSVDVDAQFRMDLEALEQALQQGDVSLVVANLASTGTGSVDDVQSLLQLRERYNFHLHVDGAYGGFFRTLLVDSSQAEHLHSSHPLLTPYVCTQLQLMAQADSVTLDPHKHGMLTYGCGAVFFRDPELKQLHLHSAPYTYNHTDRPNLGLFSLEGSRPGAQAASCYLTYRLLPLHEDGMGQVVATTLQAARRFEEYLNASRQFEPVHKPDTDIVCFSHRDPSRNAALYDAFAVTNPDAPFYLSRYNSGEQVMLRAVFMQPLQPERMEQCLQLLMDQLENTL